MSPDPIGRGLGQGRTETARLCSSVSGAAAGKPEAGAAQNWGRESSEVSFTHRSGTGTERLKVEEWRPECPPEASSHCGGLGAVGVEVQASNNNYPSIQAAPPLTARPRGRPRGPQPLMDGRVSDGDTLQTY